MCLIPADLLWILCTFVRPCLKCVLFYDYFCFFKEHSAKQTDELNLHIYREGIVTLTATFSTVLQRGALL